MKRKLSRSTAVPKHLQQPWGFYFPGFVDHIKDMHKEQMTRAVYDEQSRLSDIAKRCVKGTVGDYLSEIERLLDYLVNDSTPESLDPHDATLYIKLLRGLVAKQEMSEKSLSFFVKASVPRKS